VSTLDIYTCQIPAKNQPITLIMPGPGWYERLLKNPILYTHQLICSKVDTCPPLVFYCQISFLFLLPWKKDATDVRELRIMMTQFYGQFT
jgi:hypothetical protein